MDSITQAVLGAAMGEAILGKKMGNKAIAIGALAGTIPDLDVLSRLFIDHSIYGLVYHRGLSHSIAFTLFAAPVFGWLTMQYYKSNWRRNKVFQLSFALLAFLAVLAIAAGLGYATFSTGSSVLALLTALMGFGTYRMFFSLHRSIEESATDDFSSVRLKDWSLMYFLAFLTHWLIDTCTAYGTQIFEPFSNYRVAFNNISIVDPIYTVPFILGLSIIAFIRTPKLRQRVNTAVLAFTTLYLAFTFFAKSTVNKVFAENIDAQGIKALKYTTYPSLGNTILWQTTVETDSAFYYGMYSLLDKKKEIDFVKLPKNHDLLAKVDTHEYVEILKWFAQGYYNVIRRPDGRLQFNNLRFGLMSTDPSVPYDRRFVFKFIIEEKDGKVDVIEDRDMSSIPINKLFAQLFTRIKGVE